MSHYSQSSSGYQQSSQNTFPRSQSTTSRGPQREVQRLPPIRTHSGRRDLEDGEICEDDNMASYARQRSPYSKGQYDLLSYRLDGMAIQSPQSAAAAYPSPQSYGSASSSSSASPRTPPTASTQSVSYSTSSYQRSSKPPQDFTPVYSLGQPRLAPQLTPPPRDASPVSVSSSPPLSNAGSFPPRARVNSNPPVGHVVQYSDVEPRLSGWMHFIRHCRNNNLFPFAHGEKALSTAASVAWRALSDEEVKRWHIYAAVMKGEIVNLSARVWLKWKRPQQIPKVEEQDLEGAKREAQLRRLDIASRAQDLVASLGTGAFICPYNIGV